MTFYNEGLNAFANYIRAPGTTQAVTSTANVDFAPGTIFLSGPDPTFSKNPASFSFPIPLSGFVLNGGRSINSFNPDLKSPYTSNWMFGIQRELARGLVLDVRYVGNKSTHMWHMQNLQEINIVENGFIQEFVNARNNLAINRAAGVQSFANRGLRGPGAAADLRDRLRRQRIAAGAEQQLGFRQHLLHSDDQLRIGGLDG